MASTRNSKRSAMQMEDDYRVRDGFDVVCSIGRVEFSSVGDTHPRVAAFMLIAGHGADGHFTFPDEDGSILHVTVERQLSNDIGEPTARPYDG